MMAVVTGGSASGKSQYAEELAVSLWKSQRSERRELIYAATMLPGDEECQARIARHRALRAEKKFNTIEHYKNLSALSVPKGSVVLLECMSNLLANELYQEGGAKENSVPAIQQGISRIRQRASHLVIVTNEVCSAGNALDEDTIFYMRQLGRLNQWMAEAAEQVIEVIYSIPVFHK